MSGSTNAGDQSADTTSAGDQTADTTAADDRPVQAAGLDVTEVEDGLVVYDPVKRRVHHLNATAVLVFELATGENALLTIVEVVQRVFGLSEPPHAEVAALLAQLRTEGLIR